MYIIKNKKLNLNIGVLKMKIMLPSGDSMIFEEKVNMFEIAKKISSSLAKNL